MVLLGQTRRNMRIVHSVGLSGSLGPALSLALGGARILPLSHSLSRSLGFVSCRLEVLNQSPETQPSHREQSLVQERIEAFRFPEAPRLRTRERNQRTFGATCKVQVFGLPQSSSSGSGGAEIQACSCRWPPLAAYKPQRRHPVTPGNPPGKHPELPQPSPAKPAPKLTSSP